MDIDLSLEEIIKKEKSSKPRGGARGGGRGRGRGGAKAKAGNLKKQKGQRLIMPYVSLMDHTFMNNAGMHRYLQRVQWYRGESAGEWPGFDCRCSAGRGGRGRGRGRGRGGAGRGAVTKRTPYARVSAPSCVVTLI